ncbi:hypothetical protein O6P43_033217 [Quillaja saponaria]|uniref:Uncharacterized protein n=1 Tax=Quillaja saponaria TaxID=32244 RepID=A0AAD7KQ20_QUISA|nr:hypothetical protein O6P43_033217 [Quillaja saponaria]
MRINQAILPGKSDASDCTGNLPPWSCDKRYEITYYNEALRQEKKIKIKDLDGNWLVSFWQEGIDEDVRALRPRTLDYDSKIQLTLQVAGYEIYSMDYGCTQGRMAWQPIYFQGLSKI